MKQRLCQTPHLTKHQHAYTREQPCQCPVCGKGFGDRSNPSTHRQVHTGEKPCWCGGYGEHFSQSSSLVIHHRHTPRSGPACVQSGACLSNSSLFSAHCRTHTAERPYTCPACGQGFCQCTDLHKHQRTHSGEKHPHGTPRVQLLLRPSQLQEIPGPKA